VSICDSTTRALMLDLMILWRTFGAVVRGDGAY
jgi:hypothetical protein